MAKGVTLDWNTPQVARSLRRLAGVTVRGIAETLNKVAFEIRDAEHNEIERAFDFAGSTSRRFLTKSIVFDRAIPSEGDHHQVVIHPRPKAAPILYDQATGARIGARAGAARRLQLRGKLAVPVGIKRGPRGKVKASTTPAKLLKARKRRRSDGSHYFVNAKETVILKAVGGGVEVAYALVPQAKLEDRFKFIPVAIKTARVEFPIKARAVMDKHYRQAKFV